MNTITKELLSEFEAEDNSFIIELRTNLNWNHAKFVALLHKMYDYCEKHVNKDDALIDRKIAEGFWYFSTFIRDWSSHPDFKKPYPTAYYNNAYELLWNFAYWFFNAQSIFISNESYLKEIDELNKLYIKTP